MGATNLQVCTNIVFDKAQFSTIYAWGTATYGISFPPQLRPLAVGNRRQETSRWPPAATSPREPRHGHRHRAGDGRTRCRRKRARPRPHPERSLRAQHVLPELRRGRDREGQPAWFHIRERRTFGGIFGILISLGLYFAFDWCRLLIVESSSAPFAFSSPGILGFFALADWLIVRDTPGEAGHEFDLGDASSGDDGPRSRDQVAKKMLRQRTILIIAAIEVLQRLPPQRDPPVLQGLRRGRARRVAGDEASGDEARARSGHNAAEGDRSRSLGHAELHGGHHGRRDRGAHLRPRLRLAPWSRCGRALRRHALAAGIMFFTMGTSAIGWVVVLADPRHPRRPRHALRYREHGLRRQEERRHRRRRDRRLRLSRCTSLESKIAARSSRRAAAEDAANWWTWPAVILPAAVIGLALATRGRLERASGSWAAAHQGQRERTNGRTRTRARCRGRAAAAVIAGAASGGRCRRLHGRALRGGRLRSGGSSGVIVVVACRSHRATVVVVVAGAVAPPLETSPGFRAGSSCP